MDGRVYSSRTGIGWEDLLPDIWGSGLWYACQSYLRCLYGWSERHLCSLERTSGKLFLIALLGIGMLFRTTKDDARTILKVHHVTNFCSNIIFVYIFSQKLKRLEGGSSNWLWQVSSVDVEMCWTWYTIHFITFWVGLVLLVYQFISNVKTVRKWVYNSQLTLSLTCRPDNG